MALTRTIPIHNRIFKPDDLAAILGLISSYYHKDREDYARNDFSLQLTENETTTLTLDAPPSNFASLLTTSIQDLSLTVDVRVPERYRIDFTLGQGRASSRNSVRISGIDQDWVNLAHHNISKQLDQTNEQSTVAYRYRFLFGSVLTLVMGWALKNVFLAILSAMGQTKKVPWSAELFGQHLFLSVFLGILPAMGLLTYTISAFPSIEILTGPERAWTAAIRRKKLAAIAALTVMAPSANLLYDGYRALFS